MEKKLQKLNSDEILKQRRDLALQYSFGFLTKEEYQTKLKLLDEATKKQDKIPVKDYGDEDDERDNGID